MRRTEAGWILLEAVALGLIVLAAAAVLGIFARTAILEEQAAARMGAAFLARSMFSAMEADLDRGIPPENRVSETAASDASYTVQVTALPEGEFFDVRLRISWRVLRREESADFVRRLREHVRTASTP